MIQFLFTKKNFCHNEQTIINNFYQKIIYNFDLSLINKALEFDVFVKMVSLKE